MIQVLQRAFGFVATFCLCATILLLLLSFEVLQWNSSLAWRMVKLGGDLGFVAFITGAVWWILEWLSAEDECGEA